MQNRREFLKTLAVGAAGIAIFPRITRGWSKDAWETLYPEILGRIKPPTFPKKDFDITKFGAKTGSVVVYEPVVLRFSNGKYKKGLRTFDLLHKGDILYLQIAVRYWDHTEIHKPTINGTANCGSKFNALSPRPAGP